MPYAELAQRGDRVGALVTRDLEHFINLGYPEDLPIQVKTQTNEFKDQMPDMYYEGHQMLKTDEKKQLRHLLDGQLGELRFRIKLVLDENSPQYKLFRFSSLARLNDKEVVSYSKHVTQMAQKFLTQLAARRVDQAMLDEIVATTARLDESIETQAEAIAQREEKSVERVVKANALYDLIVEVCEVGKRIWENKNEAFYDDYVLYGSSKSAEVAAGEEEVPAENEAENL